MYFGNFNKIADEYLEAFTSIFFYSALTLDYFTIVCYNVNVKIGGKIRKGGYV